MWFWAAGRVLTTRAIMKAAVAIVSLPTRRETWRVIGEQPTPGQVTTQAVRWGDGWVISGGEIRPGVRTADSVFVTVKR